MFSIPQDRRDHLQDGSFDKAYMFCWLILNEAERGDVKGLESKEAKDPTEASYLTSDDEFL